METVKVGHGRECITPPMGMKMAGYGRRTEGATDVHDDLFINAVVLESQDEKVALLTYDLCGLNTKMVAEIKSAIREDTGLEPGQILMNWSHTHSGPALGRKEPDEIQKAYWGDLTRKSLLALGAALEDTAPATLSAGAAPVDVGCNRRVRREDGATVLGHNPDGPTLHEMTVWRLARSDKPDVVLFSTPMHGTVLGGWSLTITAEWMGRARERLETEVPNTRFVFLQGCGADQDPYYTVRSEFRMRGTFGELEQHGKAAATSVRQALEEMHEVSALPLRSVLQSVELPPKEKGGEPQQLPLHGVRLGDAMIAALGCEAVVEYALFGREVSPAKETLILGYSNGWMGYLPTADMHPDGGLEVVRSRVAAESEQIVKDAMQQLFQDLAG